MCQRCHGTGFKISGASLICKNCGLETDRHAMNVQLEYEDVQRNMQAKMRVEAVKEKGVAGSPSKRGKHMHEIALLEDMGHFIV